MELATHAWRLSTPLCVLLFCSGCSSSRHLSFLNPQGTIAAAERTHFLWVVGILVVFVALPIFAFLPWVLWRYRYRATASRYSPGWKSNLPLEIMTWAGPIVIVIVLGIMLWRYTHELDPYQPITSDTQAVMQVQAIGYDWKWLFIYPDQGIASVGMLAIPVGRPVAMQLTSATVMQSLHIPALVSQIYAMGGMITQLHLKATKPGRSLGMNNMYNGKGFYKQRFTAVAMTPDNFKAWVGKVRKIGLPMDTRTYGALSESGTVADLASTLPRAAHDGHVFLTHVSPALFTAVVEQTMTDTRAALHRVLELSAPPPTAGAQKTPTSSVENKP